MTLLSALAVTAILCGGSHLAASALSFLLESRRHCRWHNGRVR